MRKVFWCSLTGGIMLLGGVITVAHFAARNPESFAGRAVLSAGRLAIGTNPVSVLSSTIARLEKGEAACEEAPAGGEEYAEPAERPEPQGAIVIPDKEPVCLHPEIDPAFERPTVIVGPGRDRRRASVERRVLRQDRLPGMEIAHVQCVDRAR